MPSLTALIAPLVLLLPGAAGGDAAGDGQALTPQVQIEQPVFSDDWLGLEDAGAMPIQRQVRIQQRVIIRVSPRSPSVRQNLIADLPKRERPDQVVERKIGKCVDMGGIAGVQPTRDNRLMLYMRDQRMIAANLEKACSARDFYSGFYVEPSKDGRLCIDRDKLQSRTGAKCELSRIRQLVAE